MIFPQFGNQEIIDGIRKKFDPLYHLVSPHITLVFPFKSDMSNVMLRRNLDSTEKMEQAYDSVKDMDIRFTTIIEKVSVEMIGSNGESNIIIEQNLINTFK